MKYLLGRLASNFLKGLLALLPLFITLTIVFAVFNFIEAKVETLTAWVPEEYKTMAPINVVIEIATFIILVIAITLFGILVKSLWGKVFLSKINSFLETIPGISAIYKSTRQVVDLLTVDKSGNEMKPVLAEYPSSGLWTVAFRTGEAAQGFSPDDSGRKYHTVFIPTTPNPTSGFLIIMPDEKVKPLNVSFETAIKMILTVGMVKE
ncbi:MAG: DUF502 domain-containing protein [Fibrobacteres bacterium]|nr:DUF502 domain-containing protein [Fibrobacterota bacterium]